MDFEEQFKILVYFHLQGYDSMRDLIQVFKEDDFAKAHLLLTKNEVFYKFISCEI